MNLFFLTIEQWFWHTWDNLWRLIGLNIVLFAIAMPLWTLPPVPAVLWFSLIMGPLFTATIAWCWPMADDRSPGLHDLLMCLRRTALPALVLHLVFVTVMGLLTLNLWFYRENGPEIMGLFASLFLMGITLWVAISVIILWLWAQVALGERREAGPRGLRGSLKQAGRIVLCHPLLSLGHAMVLMLFSYVMIRSMAGMAVFWLTPVAVYLATAVHEMYFEAEAKAEEARAAEEEPTKRPTSWKEVMQADEREQQTRRGRRPRRSLREIIKPWDV